MKKTTTLYLKVEYDDALTDPESLCSALDTLMETALSIPGVLDDYGGPNIGLFFPTEAEA